MSNKSGTSQNIISLPKGGGAVKGLGETFSPNLFTGTGNFSIPIGVPEGRNGLQPDLTLAYSTGSGNGPFGLGWALSIPGVTRKIAKGIPQYRDNEEDFKKRDTFILSGAEDLAPVTGSPEGAQRYRPRTEGLFARIDHHRDTENDYWKVQSKDGLISYYGTPGNQAEAPSVIADPTDRDKITAWKLSRTQDLFGNHIIYEYERDLVEGDRSWDQLYLKRIRYVDYTAESGDIAYLVSVSFIYEDRPDPFSEYRSGFEIRTRKRCSRVEVRTHADIERLVSSAHFIYLDQRTDLEDQQPLNSASLLSQVKVVGHDGEETEEMPPLEFGYSTFSIENRDFFPLQGLQLPTQSLGSDDLEMVDLFSNGLPDIVQMNGTVRYWRNLGNGRFDIPREMKEVPFGLSLADAEVQFIDANGDGRIDLMATNNGLPGYYSLKFDPVSPTWDHRTFHRQKTAPSFNLADPEVRLVDINGDGVTDAVRSGSRMEYFFNDPDEGWNSARFVERRDLEVFPNVNFSDPRVQFADMSGDGLQDIVLLHDGNIEYWPNLGHGNWGRRVRMHNSPRFPYNHDPRRILLGDIDGDGFTDIIYIGHRKITLWINQSGNGWSAPIEINGTPDTTNMDAVRLADMLGSGLAGILWSRDAGEPGNDTLLYLDITGSRKPYLLQEMNNNMGAITRVKYEPSTHFYLEDQKRPETRWQTPLPMPALVVACSEVIDEISGGKLTTEYRYHHGYWDGTEQEFRGFGRVDQFDTEVFDDYNTPGLHPEKNFKKIDAQMFSPPLETRSWFHLGPVGEEDGEWHEADYSHEYWSGDPNSLERPPEIRDFLKNLPRRAKRDALRTLRGSILRTELYALDGSKRQERPYTVTEALTGVREETGSLDDRFRLFFPIGLAQRSAQWERSDDPMTQFSFTDDYDEYGQPLKQFSIAVPRGRNYRETLTEVPLEPYLSTYSESELINRDEDGHYLIGRSLNAKAFEILNDGRQNVFELAEAIRNGNAARKILSQSITYYDGPAFEGLPYGEIGDYGVPVRGESLVLTEEILFEAYKSGDEVLDPPEMPPYLVPDAAPQWGEEYPQSFREKTPELAGYIFREGEPGSPFVRGYFAPGAGQKFDFQDPEIPTRGLLLQTQDPLGNKITTHYDEYDFLPRQVIDPLGLTVTSEIDYRVFQPKMVTDENDNRSAAVFSPLGFVTAAIVMGKPEENLGDTFEVPGSRMEYDFFAFMQRKQPVYVRSIVREHHVNDTHVPLPQRDDTIISVEYSDGFGRLLQTRTQAEEVIFGSAPFGSNVGLPVNQSIPPKAAVGQRILSDGSPRVIVSGLQVYNNKGWVVEQYEPFYSQGFNYLPPEAEELGQKVITIFDPRGQAIQTLNPDGSEQRVIYGIPDDLDNPDAYSPTPWEAYTYDVNDNAGRTHLTESVAYSHYWNTPASIVVDALGRTVEAVERNRQRLDDGRWSEIEEYHTISTYDIRGNLLTVIDAKGREAFRYFYNLIAPEEDEESGETNPSPVMRIESIDAGLRRMVFDAFGNEIERRDSKGAMILQTQDTYLRPLEMWARDDASHALTLREKSVYADDPDSGLSPEAARSANLQGQLYKNYDEAGCVIIEKLDFKGNPLESIRIVIADEAILSAFNNPSPGGQIEAFRVNWQPPQGVSFPDHAATLLEDKAYRTSTSFDALDRAEKMIYPEDVEGRRKALRPVYNRAGNLEQVTLFASLLEEKEGQGGDIYVERIAYDAKGQRILIAYGNGVMTRYAYDEKTFRLKRLRSERYRKADELTYQPVGIPLQDLAYDYDLGGNILSITDRTPGSGIQDNPQAALVDDPELRLLIAAGNALVRHFSYDPIYRLINATGRECQQKPQGPPWNDDPRCGFNAGNHGTPNQNNAPRLTKNYRQEYTYDPMGNMLALRHINYGNGNGFTRRFNDREGGDNYQFEKNNRLENLSIGDTDYYYSFDANGNMTAEHTSRHFEWDHSDQLKAFRTQAGNVEASVHAHYLYDTGGMRVKKFVRKSDGRIDVTVYPNEMFEYHRRVYGNGQIEENNTLHVMDDSQRIALLRAGEAFEGDEAPALQYHLGDHLGSGSLVIDGSGEWVNREEYFPYGETSLGSFAHKRYRYTGKEQDEESGLNYHVMRYYAVWLTRWLSTDPIGILGGTNSYLYSSSNPSNLIDDEGLQPTTPSQKSIWAKIGSFIKGLANPKKLTKSRIVRKALTIAALAGEPDVKLIKPKKARPGLTTQTPTQSSGPKPDPPASSNKKRRSRRNSHQTEWQRRQGESRRAKLDNINQARRSEVTRRAAKEAAKNAAKEAVKNVAKEAAKGAAKSSIVRRLATKGGPIGVIGGGIVMVGLATQDLARADSFPTPVGWQPPSEGNPFCNGLCHSYNSALNYGKRVKEEARLAQEVEMARAEFGLEKETTVPSPQFFNSIVDNSPWKKQKPSCRIR